jgi:hypothetical protein
MLQKNKKIDHWPTLNTVIMVERSLKNCKESVIRIAELKKILPKQVNHNTLIIILKYLQESNKILVTLDGITWIHNTNSNLRNALNKGLEI